MKSCQSDENYVKKAMLYRKKLEVYLLSMRNNMSVLKQNYN